MCPLDQKKQLVLHLPFTYTSIVFDPKSVLLFLGNSSDKHEFRC